MHTLENLRRQIDTATDLGSVVTMMKTLAAVSIHQYEQAVEALGDYDRTIELGFQVALSGKSFDRNHQDSIATTAAIVFGSTQGMCGQFNEAIVSMVNEQIAKGSSQQPWLLLAVGKRVEEQLAESGRRIEQSYELPTSVHDITDLIQDMLPNIERLRRTSRVEKLLVFYNRRTSASTYRSQYVQVLPMDLERLQRWQREPWNSRSLPTFATDPRTLLSRLIRQYLFVALFTACAESLASENASRIAAMQAAEQNIEERLEELRVTFNQLRQTAITEELLDVVTGFEALAATRHRK